MSLGRFGALPRHCIPLGSQWLVYHDSPEFLPLGSCRHARASSLSPAVAFMHIHSLSPGL